MNDLTALSNSTDPRYSCAVTCDANNNLTELVAPAPSPAGGSQAGAPAPLRAAIPLFQDNFLYTYFEYDALNRMPVAATLLSPFGPAAGTPPLLVFGTLFGRPLGKDSNTAWSTGTVSAAQNINQNPVTSRLMFEGTVTSTDYSRITDMREKGRIGIYGTGLSCAGASPRVTSESIGRDLNPLGRGDGRAYVGGGQNRGQSAQNLGRVSPSLPGSTARFGTGNSVNNWFAGPGGGGNGPYGPCNDNIGSLGPNQVGYVINHDDRACLLNWVATLPDQGGGACPYWICCAAWDRQCTPDEWSVCPYQCFVRRCNMMYNNQQAGGECCFLAINGRKASSEPSRCAPPCACRADGIRIGPPSAPPLPPPGPPPGDPCACEACVSGCGVDPNAPDSVVEAILDIFLCAVGCLVFVGNEFLLEACLETCSDSLENGGKAVSLAETLQQACCPASCAKACPEDPSECIFSSQVCAYLCSSMLGQWSNMDSICQSNGKLMKIIDKIKHPFRHSAPEGFRGGGCVQCMR